MIRVALAAMLLLLTPAPVNAVTTWRVALVVYESLDASCNGVQRRAAVGPGEVEEAVDVASRAAARIDAAGDGALSFTVIRAGTLTSVDALDGGSCWPSPGNLQAMGDWPVGFDSVFVLYENDDDATFQLNGWGGLSYACGACAFGATYGTEPIWDGGEDWFDAEHAAAIFIHEWGNGTGGFYRGIFGEAQVPSLYADRSRYAFTSWYDDWYGGRLVDRATGDNVGLEPHVWAYGTPTRLGPDPKACKNPQSNAKACR